MFFLQKCSFLAIFTVFLVLSKPDILSRFSRFSQIQSDSDSEIKADSVRFTSDSDSEIKADSVRFTFRADSEIKADSLLGEKQIHFEINT